MTLPGLTVVLERERRAVERQNTLRAYVLQGGRRGRNLLPGYMVTDVEHAKALVIQALAKLKLEVANWRVEE